MHKKSFYFKIFLLLLLAGPISCRDEKNEKKAPESLPGVGGNGGQSTQKGDSALKGSQSPSEGIATGSSKVDNPSPTPGTEAKSTAVEKKSKAKLTVSPDTVSGEKKNPASKTAAPPAASSPAPQPSVSAPAASTPGPPAVFVPKFGTIPRNATNDNITGFLNAFPDKRTVIKINFDAAPDEEMNGVKAQITKVLKTAGYTNVVSQSQTVEPRRMPTEIHYELQRDGSVIFWVPVAPQP